MQFVACKTVNEYNRNQEKKQFLLTKDRKNKQPQLSGPQPITIANDEAFSKNDNYHLEKPGPRSAPTKPQTKHQPRKNQATRPSKRPLQKTAKDFDQKLKEAALAQSRLNKAKQRPIQKSQQSVIQLDTSLLQQNKPIVVSDSSQGSPITVDASKDLSIFENSTSKTTQKIDKITKGISNSPKKT